AVLLVPVLQPVDLRAQVGILHVAGRHVLGHAVQEGAHLVRAVASLSEFGAREGLVPHQVRRERLAFRRWLLRPRHLPRHCTLPPSLVSSSKRICSSGTPASSRRVTVPRTISSEPHT